MDLNQEFHRIWTLIRQDANFKPRDYQTIGGGWATDTWEFNNVRAMLQDEGYTRVLVDMQGGARAYQTGERPVAFLAGDLEDFKAMVERFPA